MMSFNECIHKYRIEKAAKSNIYLYPVLSSSSLNDIGFNSIDGPSNSDIGMLIQNHFEALTGYYIFTKAVLIHMVVLFLENYLKPKTILTPNGYCFYSEYEVQDLTKKNEIFIVENCVYK